MKLREWLFNTEEDESTRRMASPEGTFQAPPAGGGTGGDGGAGGGAAGGDGGTGGGAQAFVPSPHWDLYREKLPEAERTNFKVPEGLTKETEMAELDKHFSQIYGKAAAPTFDNLHPLAREVQELAKDPNFKPDEFIKSKSQMFNIDSIPNDDLIKSFYLREYGKTDQRPNGLTEEAITNSLANMTDLQKTVEASKIREAEKERAAKMYEYKPVNINEDPAAKTAYLGEVDKYINGIFKPESERGDKAREVRSFAGVDLGETEFQSMKEDMRKLLVPNEKGNIPLMEMLSDDAMLFKFAMFSRMEGKLKDKLVQARNEGKFSAIDLLPDNPGAGGAGYQGSTKLTEEEMQKRFASPEGTY